MYVWHSRALVIATILLKSAKGWDHQTELSKHESQTDAAKGFGGKFGVQKEKQDQVCSIREYMGEV